MESWGQYGIINLVDCDPYTIKDEDTILSWGLELIDSLEMTAYGDPFIKRFALHDPKVAGYTYFQAIETSNISAHFAEITNTAFLTIFSCKNYNVDKAIEVCYKFFNCKSHFIKNLNMMTDGDIIDI